MRTTTRRRFLAASAAPLAFVAGGCGEGEPEWASEIRAAAFAFDVARDAAIVANREDGRREAALPRGDDGLPTEAAWAPHVAWMRSELHPAEDAAREAWRALFVVLKRWDFAAAIVGGRLYYLAACDDPREPDDEWSASVCNARRIAIVEDRA